MYDTSISIEDLTFSTELTSSEAVEVSGEGPLGALGCATIGGIAGSVGGLVSYGVGLLFGGTPSLQDAGKAVATGGTGGAVGGAVTCLLTPTP